ncbi:MAG: hypothetical protein ABI325_02650 [Ginsengibacter sp.]
MKYFVNLLLSLLISVSFAKAQTPMKTTAEYNGQKYPCYIVEYNLPPDETENVIKEKLRAQGYNPSKSKGYLVYRNVKLNDLDNQNAQDVLFNIERKSRKEKDKSIMTMITAKAGLIPEDKVKGTKMVADIEPSPNSVSFINSFQSGISAQAYQLAVTAQEDEVAKAEKKLKSLQDDQIKLEKKIKDYQSDLEVNKKDQDKQVDEIANQKSILEKKKNDKPAQ